jgi:Spy/CpxP family protein refolding chaperone
MSADSSRRVALLGFFLLLGSVALADPGQGPQAPRSKWWHQADVQRALRLTPAQVRSLESAFQETFPQRRALGRELETMDRTLQSAILSGDVDDATLARLSARTERVRAKRYVARTLMLVKMYRVLTPEQRGRLHDMTRGSARDESRQRMTGGR